MAIRIACRYCQGRGVELLPSKLDDVLRSLDGEIDGSTSIDIAKELSISRTAAIGRLMTLLDLGLVVRAKPAIGRGYRWRMTSTTAFRQRLRGR